MLRCLYSKAEIKVGRLSAEDLGIEGVSCDVAESVKLAVNVDAYRTAIQLYELLQNKFEDIKEVLKGIYSVVRGDDRQLVQKVRNDIEFVEKRVKADLDIAMEIKSYVDDYTIKEALDILFKLYEQYKQVAKDHDLFDDFFPLMLSVEKEGFVWRDTKTDARGRGLKTLSTVYAPALVAMYMLYAYGASDGRDVYLLVEEPEAHAHPVMAHFLGRLALRLAERAEERGYGFHAVFATHSLDFLTGAYGKVSKAYILRRSPDRIYVEGTWDGGSYIPGLSDTGAYQLFTR
ncbi:hypothetical protein Pogu_1131 [Pyrobaculum oguniense TE7]|uniref:AAA domain-containing protein n=1 Tax=Pyrobaculum oguniense (strain DSM 13380 / JCM 10595 / TE7) TaxID=698757 RepID=H6QA36_PYROT|nr:hypothetical protein Pogu_1131 [Pyrobaculum oguniense TE7]